MSRQKSKWTDADYSMYWILDDRDEPVPIKDFERWCKWMDAAYTTKQRIVARDSCSRYTVSTVFLGMDHGFCSMKVVLYETMVFDEMTGDSAWCERSESRAQAIRCHERGLAFARNEFSYWKMAKRWAKWIGKALLFIKD